jgi:hypothetical protein
VDDVKLTGENGRTLTLKRVSHRDDESVWSYEATLAVPGGAMTTIV